MKITKLGHSCLYIEEKNARLLIDPGMLSQGFEDLTGLDAVLITHEHEDHCYIENLTKILTNNPSAIIYTNTGTAEKVKNAGLPYRVLDSGQTATIKDVEVEAFGVDHNLIHPDIPLVRNSGFLVAEKFFHPGDSYTVPNKQVEILALPVGGPWLKVQETIDFGLKIKPTKSFPIHDGLLTDQGKSTHYFAPGKILGEAGIGWVVLEPGVSKEF